MRAPAFGAIGFGAVVVAAVLLAVIGAPGGRPSPRAMSPTAAPAPPPGVSAGGFTLTSAAIDLPEGRAAYPAGPHAGAMNANCTACHSPSMVLTQPRLKPDQWKAEVTKMREVYKAPVPDAAVPDILAYLAALPSQRPSP